MKRSEVVANMINALNFRAILPFSWLWVLPLPAFTQEKRSYQILENVFEQIISNHENSTENTSGEEFNGTDMVTLLLQTQQKNDPRKYSYSHKEMLSECFSLFIAGQETTARMALFIIHEISNKCDVQRKIREEIELIANENGEQDWENYTPIYEDLNKMKYIDNVVKETQRLWPIIPELSRMSTEEDYFDNFYIPKGVSKILVKFL